MGPEGPCRPVTPETPQPPLAWFEGSSGPDCLSGRGNILTLFMTGKPVHKP